MRRPGSVGEARLAGTATTAGIAGIAAGALTLGVAALVAAVVSPASDPLVALGGTFIDATPAWLKNVAVRVFGTSDKLALTIGMVIVVAALAALAGVLARRRWELGAALVVVLGVVAAIAAASRPGAGSLAPAPSLLGAVAGLVALHALIRRLPPPSRAPAASQPDDDVPLPRYADRRTFLRATGLVALGGALAVVGGRALGAGHRTVVAARAALHLPGAARPAALPAGVDASLDGTPVAGVDPWVTPNPDFYRIDTALSVPDLDPSTWSLRVHGLVEHEVMLTFADLLAADLVEAWVTLACVSNEVGGNLVGNAKWLGLPVREVLARAVPLPDADMVLSRSADGFTASTPIEVLTDARDALLAVGMNGAPLPVEHGFPVRMVVPGLYGYVSATKWVVDLEVTRFADATAYWTDRGWSDHGPVKTESRIEVPRSGPSVKAGRVVVAGTAWAQHRGIVGVEVRVDDGPWQAATLAADGGIDSWRQWALAWDATPGDHTLQCRAIDPDGPQTDEVADVIPDGATGLHTIPVHVKPA
ncbi:MAG TPA: molybdopterin-dependent oxidoreductase [Cellulomonas sp.]|uniref:molybdopterin-dependent oxidoreductase n=1 Tax=Cellulomonas sp. TaxID=40001 RepID=UPI002E35B306|nr:molybdopterin-dependent oxidoreductase [Cellulomonas sp.]HEX5331724.1 molybdopterin-dependent oxidoreductase [Cellulomonas sp.]